MPPYTNCPRVDGDMSARDAERLFAHAIEAWRGAVGIEKIDLLVGHSFGGFLSTAYSIYHRNRINKMVLWSPPFGQAPNKEKGKPKTWLGVAFFTVYDYCFENKVSPHKFFESFGPFGKRFIHWFANWRFTKSNLANDPGLDPLCKYCTEIVSFSGGTDRSIFWFWESRLVAVDPIAKRYPTDLVGGRNYLHVAILILQN